MLKRKCVQQVTTNTTAKNLRSKIPRRRRSHISPILHLATSSPPPPPPSKQPTSAADAAISLNSTLDEVSCNTTLHSINDGAQKPPAKPHQQKQQQVSLSEHSCVESCSVAAVVPADEVSFSVAQHSPANTTATVEQKTAAAYTGEYDLACDEELSYGDYEVTSAVDTFSELQSEIFSSSDNYGGGRTSEFDDIDFSDEYTPSIWLNDSGSQFSEKSFDDDSAPSPCFSLFTEFKQQFLKLTSDFADFDASSLFNDQYNDDLAYWKFEDEEDEESYNLLRNRERNQAAKVKDYIKEYDYATVIGGLIAEQRFLMVNWIIEVSRKKDLHSETMYLGVRLLDRFLSKGCFTSRRNLEILGIACLTLAIRIEENQPYNSVRQKCFYVEDNTYSKTEVVAMEWVVQEVLHFHCISTTIYSFLWFYLKAAEANEHMKRKAKYLAGLTLLDHKQLQFWPSTVAAAIVILVSLSVNRDVSCQQVMEVHVRTKIDDLPECIKSLEWLVKHAL